jgi:hypothetical protein
MKNVFVMARLLFLSVIVIGGTSSCTLWDCANSESFSPEELMHKNEYVFLGSYVGLDTLAYLGSLEYRWAESNFFVIEYEFSPRNKFKYAENGQSNIYVWCCELAEKKSTYKTFLELERDELLLVYGNKITHSQDIIKVMTPMTFIDDIERLLQGKELKHPRWNTIKEDSILALRIKKNEKLNLLLAQRNLLGQVIYFTDSEHFTFYKFKIGEICYYDSSGWAHRTNREGFLKKLSLLSAMKH